MCAYLEAQLCVAVGMVCLEQRHHILELHIVLRATALKVRTEQLTHHLLIRARVISLCAHGRGED